MAPVAAYDAFLLVSFGGPEGPEDVMPFLENVTRGRSVPRERLEERAERYRDRGGVSPINAQNRALLAAVGAELEAAGHDLPVWFGNRNWHPFLDDTVAEMAAAGVRRAVAFVTSAFSSYSGCRQYLEDIERARAAVGEGAPVIDKLPPFWDHPGFLAAATARTEQGLAAWADTDRAAVRLVFTAHSIPLAQAAGCDYEAQLREASARVARRLAAPRPSWDLAFQSRSGPPQVRWLEPDIVDHIGALAAAAVRDVCVVPLGFVSDHMEVLEDLDIDAAETAARLGLRLVRASTVGTHPRFVAMIRELVEDRLAGHPDRSGHCGPGCCPPPVRGRPRSC